MAPFQAAVSARKPPHALDCGQDKFDPMGFESGKAAITSIISGESCGAVSAVCVYATYATYAPL